MYNHLIVFSIILYIHIKLVSKKWENVWIVGFSINDKKGCILAIVQCCVHERLSFIMINSFIGTFCSAIALLCILYFCLYLFYFILNIFMKNLLQYPSLYITHLDLSK